jgi:diacylglycerol O-acyltransferase
MSTRKPATHGSAARKGRRIMRLTSVDRMYLHDETAAWPCHFGGLAVVDGRALLDAAGRLRIGEIRDRLDRRLARVPEFRRRLHDPGPLRGGPIWVDDDRFVIERHVNEAVVPPPGGDSELMDTAARLYGALLDRGHPLWELWFLSGLDEGRVGVLLKLHHAVADGTAAVGVMGSLFDLGPDAQDPASVVWAPEPGPGAWSLLADNVSGRIGTVGRAAALLARPLRVANAVRLVALVTRRMLGQKGAPRTSLNRVVRAGRRVRFQRIDLVAAKEAAHAHDGTVNDVVLDLWSGGLRRLLMSRGEPVEGVELVAGQAVSLRPQTGSGGVDNRAGTIVLRLPVWDADPRRRLDRIVRTTRVAKAGQQAGSIMGVMAALAATPLARYFNLRQRAVNVIVTNVAGPTAPMYILGARILDILPIIQLVGNIGLTLCAFSYAGEVFLVVTADDRGFPDLDVLMTGMEEDWETLTTGRVAEPVPA